MSNYAISLKRTSILLAALAFMSVLFAANFWSVFSMTADAAQFQVRSLDMASSLDGNETTGAANSETNGSDTTHTFQFNVASTTALQAIRFEYCTTAIGACTTPTGVNHLTNDPTISVQTINGGAWGAAWAEGTHTAAQINLTNTGTGALTAGHTAVFSFTGIQNPTSAGTFFVRITSYSDAFSTVVDQGNVAQSITEGITITSLVVETLGFSTTADDAGDPAEGASCDPLTGSGALTLGDVTEGTLSISQAYDEFSAFRLYTNSANGVVVQYEGSTLTKGSDNIDAIGGTAAASLVGSEQFGLAIDPDGGIFTEDDEGFGGAGQLALGAQYNDGDGTITSGGTASFAFVADTKTTIATASSFVDCDTAAVRYIGNISPLTPAGTYTTTIVYFAVPTY